MKILYVGINAKYIHTNPAIRILKKLTSSYADSDFIEFTIKDNNESIIAILQQSQADMIGFSCYIWNIQKIKQIVKILKQTSPHLTLFAGGPEVSYQTEIAPFDYIIKGDAECSIVDFITKRIVPKTPQYVTNMNQIPFIGDEYQTVDFLQRILYLETSRGCPFRCSYCLASIQLDHVIFYEEERVFAELDYYVQQGVRTIKFLDRSFNVNPKRFLRLLEKINHQTSAAVFQFEVSADLLDEASLDYLTTQIKPGKVRLEIGVQSTHDSTNQAVDRISDIPSVLAKMKRLIAGERVVIHADLIVGLPFETFAHAQQSLRDVFQVLPHELQLGFLKCLKGTKIEREASLYDYEFSSHPPYQIIKSQFIAPHELEAMHHAEKGIEALWNRKRLLSTIPKLINEYQIDSFLFFYEIGKQINENQLKQESDFFASAYNWIFTRHPKLIDQVKWDYLTKNPIRPKRFWGRETSSFSQLKQLVDCLALFSKHQLENAFITEVADGFIVVTYQGGPKTYWIKNGLIIAQT